MKRETGGGAEFHQSTHMAFLRQMIAVYVHSNNFVLGRCNSQVSRNHGMLHAARTDAYGEGVLVDRGRTDPSANWRGLGP